MNTELQFLNDNSSMKLSELPESIRAERFCPFTEMLTDACEKLLGQAARTKQKDEGNKNKAAVVPLLNGNKPAVLPVTFVKLKAFLLPTHFCIVTFSATFVAVFISCWPLGPVMHNTTTKEAAPFIHLCCSKG